MVVDRTGTVFAYGVTSSGKTHTMHVSVFFAHETLSFVKQKYYRILKKSIGFTRYISV